MKFVVSGYTDKLSLMEFDDRWKLSKRIDKKINSSSFVVVSDYVFAYDRVDNPYVYMLDINTLEVVDGIKVNINNITHLTYSKKNHVLYGCSYAGGAFFGVKVKDNKFGEVIAVVREENLNTLSRCHCLLLNKEEDTLVVVNIATDKLNFYHIDNQAIEYLQTIVLPKGCGPRHAIYSIDENYLYVMTEYSNEVIVVDVKKGIVIEKHSTLKNQDIMSFGATLFICDNYLYASNRGEETIAEFKVLKDNMLEYNMSFPVYGDHSRHMIPTKNKEYIISCNKNTNNVCFINRKTKQLVMEFSFDNPSCIVEIK